ncbi:hypothetical protein FKM82_028756 [Ascaphus truei]
MRLLLDRSDDPRGPEVWWHQKLHCNIYLLQSGCIQPPCSWTCPVITPNSTVSIRFNRSDGSVFDMGKWVDICCGVREMGFNSKFERWLRIHLYSDYHNTQM